MSTAPDAGEAVTLTCPTCPYKITAKARDARSGLSQHRCHTHNPYQNAQRRAERELTIVRNHEAACPRGCGYTAQATTQARATKAAAQHSCERHRRRLATVQARANGAPRRVVDCTHPATRHVHGTALAYSKDSCRCTPCSQAWSTYQDEYRSGAKKVHRPPLTFVDATRIREHLRPILRTRGITTAAVAAGAQVSRETLQLLLEGRVRADGTAIPPKAKVRSDIADRLLHLTLDDVRPHLHFVPATGTTRRMQALVAAGWSPALLARTLKLSTRRVRELISQETPNVEAGTRDTVQALYDALVGIRPPMRTADECAAFDRAIRLAVKHGYAPAAAWDDIDNPRERPKGVALTHELAA